MRRNIPVIVYLFVCLFFKALTSHLHHEGLTFPSEKGGIVFLGMGHIPAHCPACEEHCPPPTKQQGAHP